MENEHSSTIAVPHSHDNRIKLNVGGKLFETTLGTLQSSGPDSLLTALSNRTCQTLDDPIFIDRDPDIFSVILSLLRTNHLPSNANCFSKQELAEEAAYYGIESHLKPKILPPPLRGFDASHINTVCPAAEAVPSAFTAPADDGSIWIAHGGQISSYDWTLSHTGTFRTHLNDINSIHQVWPQVAAVGSEVAAGIHFYNLSDGCHVGTVQWNDPTDLRTNKAPVAAITDSPTQIFASFDCQHRENCVLMIDKSTLQTVSELGRQNGSSSKTMVPSKLTWMSETGVLVTSSVMYGTFGYSGYIRLWDARSGDMVWETSEPGSNRSGRFGDSFADVCVDLEGSRLFKICSKSGDLAMADLRYLGEDPWVYLRDKSHSMRSSGGLDNYVIHSYKKQVFVGRGGGLEVWSTTEEWENGTESGEGMYRRNYVDKVEDSMRGIITKMEGGGDRLFVSRDDVEGVEVWESSNYSGIISTL